jgi:hypothetical protein
MLIGHEEIVEVEVGVNKGLGIRLGREKKKLMTGNKRYPRTKRCVMGTRR